MRGCTCGWGALRRWRAAGAAIAGEGCPARTAQRCRVLWLVIAGTGIIDTGVLTKTEAGVVPDARNWRLRLQLTSAAALHPCLQVWPRLVHHHRRLTQQQRDMSGQIQRRQQAAAAAAASRMLLRQLMKRNAPRPHLSTPSSTYWVSLETLLVGHEKDWLHSISWRPVGEARECRWWVPVLVGAPGRQVRAGSAGCRHGLCELRRPHW